MRRGDLVKATILDFLCVYCGRHNQYKVPMVKLATFQAERDRAERAEAALEEIRCNVLQTEGDKAVAIADRALGGAL